MKRLVAVTLVALALTGCAGRVEPSPTLTLDTPVPSPTATPVPTVGTAATATFVVQGKRTSLRAEYTRSGIELHVPASLFTAQYSLAFYDRPVVDDSCTAHGSGYYVENWALGTEHRPKDMAWTDAWSESVDPSVITTVALITEPRDRAIGCPHAVSVSALHWDRPVAYARLQPVDSGARDGANGTIADHGWYEVAPNDSWDVIATRFGLTPDELRWLNPYNGLRKVGLITRGDFLNLDPNGRGGSWDRVLAAGRVA